MALGGGTFTTMNKLMPGSYINYVSAARAAASLSARGIAALPMKLKWGKDKTVFSMAAEDFKKEAMDVFGYKYSDAEMLPVREVFKHAEKCLFYKLGDGTAAECKMSKALYKGSRGNDLKHVVSANVDDASLYDVETYMGNTLIDSQTVAQMADLKDNKFISWKTDAEIEATAGMNLTGGTDGTVTGEIHQAALDALEPYAFNVLGCMSEEKSVISLYTAYCKRMRDDVGVKFQLVAKGADADYIGVINLKNGVDDAGADTYALVPWVAGAEAGCAVNTTCDNMTYDGEYIVNVDYKNSEFKTMIENGEFAFHMVENDFKVLSDINSYVSTTSNMNDDFKLNQVIRVVDQIATDEAAIFNTIYLGKVQNDEDGRVSFWSDCVSIHKELQKSHAIEEFEDDDITVERGNDKRTVVTYGNVKPVCAMNKLYMTIAVS